MSLSTWYRDLGVRCADFTEDNPSWSDWFLFCQALAEALSARCALREKAPGIVRTGDRQAAKELLLLCDQAIAAMERLAEAWQCQWMEQHKPFGWEVIDLRLGGVIQRLKSAKARFSAFSLGTLDAIPELAEPKLPCLRSADGTFSQMNHWASIASPSAI